METTEWKYFTYWMSNNFAVLQALIPEVIPSQICHKNGSNSQRSWSYQYLKFKIHSSCSIKNSVMLLLSFAYFPFIYHESHRNLGSEVQWPHWPVLGTTRANPSVKELLITVLHHVLTEMSGAPTYWKYICKYVLCHSRYMNDPDVLCIFKIISGFKYL